MGVAPGRWGTVVRGVIKAGRETAGKEKTPRREIPADVKRSAGLQRTREQEGRSVRSPTGHPPKGACHVTRREAPPSPPRPRSARPRRFHLRRRGRKCPARQRLGR